MTARTRHLIDEMAATLADQVADLGDIKECIGALIQARFRASDIGQYLDPARDIARIARINESEIWARLLPQEKDHDT